MRVSPIPQQRVPLNEGVTTDQHLQAKNDADVKLDFRQIFAALKDMKTWFGALLMAGVCLANTAFVVFMPTFITEIGYSACKSPLHALNGLKEHRPTFCRSGHSTIHHDTIRIRHRGYPDRVLIVGPFRSQMRPDLNLPWFLHHRAGPPIDDNKQGRPNRWVLLCGLWVDACCANRCRLGDFNSRWVHQEVHDVHHKHGEC